jgi:hypothetical protein
MTPNNLPSERAAIVGVIDPDVTAAGSVSTGWVAAKDFLNFMAIVFAGTLGSSATLDAKIEQATDSSGTGAKDVAGKAITQMTQAGTDSDKQAIINVRQADLDIANSFTHLRLTVTVATASSDAGAVLLGFDPAYGAASDYDAATVDEIVA